MATPLPPKQGKKGMWSAKSFATRHNHSLGPAQSVKAASVANAILKKTGDEGQAIRIANSVAERSGTQKAAGRRLMGKQSG
jgi:uncharacterized protein YdaT